MASREVVDSVQDRDPSSNVACPPPLSAEPRPQNLRSLLDTLARLLDAGFGRAR